MIALLLRLLFAPAVCRCDEPAGPCHVIGHTWHCDACGRPVPPAPRPTWNDEG